MIIDVPNLTRSCLQENWKSCHCDYHVHFKPFIIKGRTGYAERYSQQSFQVEWRISVIEVNSPLNKAGKNYVVTSFDKLSKFDTKKPSGKSNSYQFVIPSQISQLGVDKPTCCRQGQISDAWAPLHSIRIGNICECLLILPRKFLPVLTATLQKWPRCCFFSYSRINNYSPVSDSITTPCNQFTNQIYWWVGPHICKMQHILSMAQRFIPPSKMEWEWEILHFTITYSFLVNVHYLQSW